MKTKVQHQIVETLRPGRYQIVRFENGFFGLLDLEAKGFQTVASGYADLSKLRTWAERLNLRHVWGK